MGGAPEQLPAFGARNNNGSQITVVKTLNIIEFYTT
jgi:hypothetical protein